MRARILEMVHRYPGLHLRDIQRRLSTSPALAEYHLNVLEELRLVTSTVEEGFRRFFPGRSPKLPLSREDQRVLGLLRQRVPLAVVLFLFDRTRATHGEIAQALHLRKSTLSFNLKRLERLGVLERAALAAPGPRLKSISLRNREHVRALLQTYEPTPDLISAYAELWSELLGSLRGAK